MKKRILSLLLSLSLCLGASAPALAAAPKAQSKTVTLDNAFIYSEVGPVKVSVTYTGWLGEIDEPYGVDEREVDWSFDFKNAPKRKVQVIEAGSEVRFSITASNPAAYSNICYEKGEFDMYTFDDCGGGNFYYYDASEGDFGSFSSFVVPNGDGTARFSGGGFTYATGKKTGTSSYAITVDEGLTTLAFNGRTPGLENWSNYGDIKARYLLGTVLAVTKEQQADILAGKTPTFHKNIDDNHFYMKYQYDYPGLAALFGAQAPAETKPKRDGLKLSIYEQGDYKPLGYTVKNTGTKAVKGCYALLSYWPTTRYYPANEMIPEEREYFYGQLLPLDVDLAPGESMKGDCWATAVGWSTMTHKWLKFESEAERDAIFRDPALLKTHYDPNDRTYELDHGSAGIQWMKRVMKITIQSGKYA